MATRRCRGVLRPLDTPHAGTRSHSYGPVWQKDALAIGLPDVIEFPLCRIARQEVSAVTGVGIEVRADQPVFKPLTEEDFYDNGVSRPEKVELGRMLFFDEILSGSANISCATCRHPQENRGDEPALSIGEVAGGWSTSLRH